LELVSHPTTKVDAGKRYREEMNPPRSISSGELRDHHIQSESLDLHRKEEINHLAPNRPGHVRFLSDNIQPASNTQIIMSPSTLSKTTSQPVGI